MHYENPILRGFCPDPSICRVGNDYYLCVSSFEYFPGIPIYHSKDLVNWKQIGNCVQRKEEFPPMKTTKDSGGIWAPSIRFNNGRFYVTATLDGYGNFIVSATEPAGEWSAPVWVEVGGIDPSLYFEDGHAYYCTTESLQEGESGISLEEIDLDTGKVIGERHEIWNGIGAAFLEGPHVYRIKDHYYIMTAEGGTQFNHMVTVGRSSSLFGPYESCPHNPVITNVHDASRQVQCTGHGDLIEDHNGNWWVVHLGTRISRRTMSHLGRETFLTPVRWENGWIVTDSNKMALLSCEGPIDAKQELQVCFQADFTKREWEPGWIFLRSPEESHYRRGEGYLKLYPSKVKLTDGKSPVFAAVRQPDFDCEIQTEFSLHATEIGDEAGLALLLNRDFHYRFCVRRKAGGTVLVLDKTAEDFHETIEVCKFPKWENGRQSIRLILRADKEKYSFSYVCENGREREGVSASTRFLADEVAGRTFTGTVIGLYTTCCGRTESVMAVSSFTAKRGAFQITSV